MWTPSFYLSTKVCFLVVLMKVFHMLTELEEPVIHGMLIFGRSNLDAKLTHL